MATITQQERKVKDFRNISLLRFPVTLLFTGGLDLCALRRCVDWSGQRSRFVRHRRTDLSEWDGQNGFGVRYTPYERRAQRSRPHPVKSNGKPNIAYGSPVQYDCVGF